MKILQTIILVCLTVVLWVERSYAGAILWNYQQGKAGNLKPPPQATPAVGDFWKDWPGAGNAPAGNGDGAYLGVRDPFLNLSAQKSITVYLFGSANTVGVTAANVTSIGWVGQQPDAQAGELINGTKKLPVPPLSPVNKYDANLIRDVLSDKRPAEYAYEVQVKATMPIQPEGEWLDLTGPFNIAKVQWIQTCVLVGNKGRIQKVKWSTQKGEVGFDPDPATDINQLWYFPDVPIDTTAVPTIVPPSGTGSWSYQYTYTDPDGNLMPNGGVEWTTTGTGITDIQDCELDVTNLSPDGDWGELILMDASENIESSAFGECVPEPSTLSLLAAASVALIAFAWQKRWAS